MTTLAAAILGLLLAQPAGVAACHSDEECAELAVDIAYACDAAGLATDTDPWLLAAIAHNESRFDADRHGRRGRGLWGLNPRGRTYRDAVRFCRLDRARCWVVQAAVAGAYLAEERRRCGSREGALRSYGSGRCAGPARYSRAVRASLARLRGVL
jgi:hypothetical protein